MGFRSTFVTEHQPNVWPEWFRVKYDNCIHVVDGQPLSSKREIKTYFTGLELSKDIQKCIDWKNYDVFVFVWLHECGGITRVEIRKDKILYSEPSEWSLVSQSTHNYCYGCSDATGITKREK